MLPPVRFSTREGSNTAVLPMGHSHPWCRCSFCGGEHRQRIPLVLPAPPTVKVSHRMSTPHPPDYPHPSPSDLSRLLCSVAAQDEEAFDELYRQCSRRVYGLVRKVLVDVDMSADTTQEVFLTLWQGGTSRYDPHKGSALSWIMTIAHRKAVDKVRLEQTHRARNLRWGLKNQSVDYDQVAETVLARDESAAVSACLDNLTAVQREAIHLAFYTGLTYSEVAHRLGIPVPTAKTRIRDGIQRLGRCLLAS